MYFEWIRGVNSRCNCVTLCSLFLCFLSDVFGRRPWLTSATRISGTSSVLKAEPFGLLQQVGECQLRLLFYVGFVRSIYCMASNECFSCSWNNVDLQPERRGSAFAVPLILQYEKVHLLFLTLFLFFSIGFLPKHLNFS